MEIKFFKAIIRNVKTTPKLSSESDDQTNLETRLEVANHLKFFFNYAYYLGVSPVRFEWNGQFQKHTWRPQQIICAVLHILCICMLVANVRESMPSNTTDNLKRPTLYFNLAMVVCTLLFKGITMKRLWFNSQDYLRLFRTLVGEKYLPVKRSQISKRGFMYLFYTYFFLVLLSLVVTGSTFVTPISKWSASWWCRRLVAQGRFIFGFSSPFKASEAPDWDSISGWDIILAVLAGLAKYSRFTMSEICDIHILVFAITLWIIAHAFSGYIQSLKEDYKGESVEQVKPHPEDSWRNIYRQFQAVQNFSVVLNKALGSAVAWNLAEGVMYYSIKMNTIFVTKDMFERFFCLNFFVITFYILYLSADIRNQMETVKSWLMKKDNVKSVPMDEAYLVLHDVITKDIGIRGNDIFTITFSFVSGYLSLIVTFFIICIQDRDGTDA